MRRKSYPPEPHTASDAACRIRQPMGKLLREAAVAARRPFWPGVLVESGREGGWEMERWRKGGRWRGREGEIEKGGRGSEREGGGGGAGERE